MELIIPNGEIDIDREIKYKEFNTLVRELGYPTLETFISTEITDRDGNIISTRNERAHSWTRNAYNIILSQVASTHFSGVATFAAGYLSTKNTSGTITYSASTYGTVGTYFSPAGDDDDGILVGTSDAGYSFEDYVLATTVIHGTGAGQLSYSATVDGGFAWTTVSNPSDTGTRIIYRYFNNNSGGSIGINEIALVESSRHLVERSVLASTDTIPDTAQYKVTYTIVITLPA